MVLASHRHAPSVLIYRPPPVPLQFLAPAAAHTSSNFVTCQPGAILPWKCHINEQCSALGQNVPGVSWDTSCSSACLHQAKPLLQRLRKTQRGEELAEPQNTEIWHLLFLQERGRKLQKATAGRPFVSEPFPPLCIFLSLSHLSFECKEKGYKKLSKSYTAVIIIIFALKKVKQALLTRDVFSIHFASLFHLNPLFLCISQNRTWMLLSVLFCPNSYLFFFLLIIMWFFFSELEWNNTGGKHYRQRSLWIS